MAREEPGAYEVSETGGRRSIAFRVVEKPRLERWRMTPNLGLTYMTYFEDPFGVRVGQPRRDGRMLPEIARELDEGEPGVLLVLLEDDLHRIVAAGVIDVDDLPVDVLDAIKDHG